MGCYVCKRVVVRNTLLLVASLFFYGTFSVNFVGILVYVALVNYICGGLLYEGEIRSRRLIVGIAVILSLLPLCFFHYIGIVEKVASYLLNLEIQEEVSKGLLIPIGISFFTFQALSYTIDVYRGKIENRPTLIDFLLFVSFFPTIFSGPIEKSRNLLPQIGRMFSPTLRDISQGATIFIWGLFKKIVVADRLAEYVDWAYDDISNLSGTTLALAAIFYSIQIYCDFSGYSDMALGVARSLGFNITKNFRQPYFSKTVRDFWHRWHISLTSWFTEYVYFAMGGNRVKSYIRYIFNVGIIFIISGLWHGSTFNFLLWGILNGLYYIVENGIGLQKRSMRWSLWGKVGSCVLIFLLMSFAWIFFRLEHFSDATLVISRICTEFHGMPEYYLSTFNYLIRYAILIIFISYELLIRYNKLSYDNKYTDTQLYCGIYASVPLLLMISLFGISKDQFVYSQF